MRKYLLVFTIITASITACKSASRQKKLTASSALKDNAVSSVAPPYSRFIPADSANKMITSYLNSIQYESNDTSLRALMIDMDQLRRYTDSMSGTARITHLKLFFAHTLEYINSGNANKYAGYRSGALTLVVAGYDSLGNYVYFRGNNVLEYCQPCPNSCPAGAAGNALLTF